MLAIRLSEARLEVPELGALVRGVHLCGSGFAGGSEVGVLEGRPALWGPHLRGRGRAVPGREAR